MTRDIAEKLQSVCDKVTGNAPSSINLGMHIPADPERDLDLIAMEAKTEIYRLRGALISITMHLEGQESAVAAALRATCEYALPSIKDEENEND